VQVAETFNQVKACADGEETQTVPATPKGCGQIFLGCGRGKGWRKLAGKKRLQRGPPGGDASRGQGFLEKEVELGTGGIGEDRIVAAGFNPEVESGGEAVDGPGGQRRGGKVAEEAADEPSDDAEADGVAGIGFGAGAQLAPEDRVAAAGQNMALELDDVSGASELAAKMLIDVQPLAEKEVDAVEHGHAQTVQASCLRTIEKG